MWWRNRSLFGTGKLMSSFISWHKKIIKFPSKGLTEAIRVVNKLLNNKNFNDYSIIDLRINNKIITQ